MKLDRIDVASMDFGVGVLRGAVSIVQTLRDKPDQVELAIEHIRRAARFVEQLQRENYREVFKKRRSRRARVRTTPKAS